MKLFDIMKATQKDHPCSCKGYTEAEYLVLAYEHLIKAHHKNDDIDRRLKIGAVINQLNDVMEGR